MLSQTVQDAINEQIKNELYSAYLYLSMAAYCEANNLPGAAHWMRQQFQEEQAHALKFFDYVYSRGGRVTLQALAQPPAAFKSVLAVFEEARAHEQKVTAMINNLYQLAAKENDPATQVLLQWYVSEQVEEEEHATRIVEQLRAAGDNAFGVLFIDQHILGARK